MKKVHIVGLIIVLITASNLHNANCCKTIRSRRDDKSVTAFDNKETTDPALLPHENTEISDCHETDDTAGSTIGDENADTPDLTSDIALETSQKIKRDAPIFPPHSEELKETPRTLLATIGEENADTLSDNPKTKRNPSDDDPLKLRRPRDKKFMCLCEETKCRNKDCLQAQIQSSREKVEEAENNAAEVLDDDINLIDKSPDGPKKFNIPFAHNVNFDQRVIVDGKNVPPKPPPLYPVYANPQMYNLAPYNLAHSGLIYTGVAPLQQNYAPAAAYNQFPSPSPIPAHLLKLWKNGAQNLIPVDNNPKTKPTPEYVPKYSSAENAKKEVPTEPSKVTTPRQINSKLYPHVNYPPQVGSNIEDLRPAYSYSTDFSYHSQPYTTEVVNADEFNFITESSAEMKHLPLGDPTTTNYAPSFYTPRSTPESNYGNLKNDEYSQNYPTALPNPYPSENIPIPVNSFESLNDAYPMNNQNIPQFDYNGMPISTLPPTVYTNIPVIDDNGYPSQENIYNPANDDGLKIEVDKMINNFINNAPMDVPNDSDLKAYNPPQNQAAQRPSQVYNQPPDFVIQPPINQATQRPSQAYNQQRDFVIQPPTSYNRENAKPPGQQQNNVPQSVTTLQDVNNGYTSHYNPQRTSTLRNANGYKPNGNVAAANNEPTNNENDDLFKGLEKIILNHGDVSDVPQIQAVDERPSMTYETTYRNTDNTVIQNAVKKVLNNFVPGKAEDLLANYNREKSGELARRNGERLSPDLAKTHVLKNLLNVPEVEEMIIDTTNNLINQVTGSPVSESMIKETLRNVVNEIPRPTTPPKNDLKIKIRMTKRVPRYDENREVFEKIKSIIEKSDLGDEAATHPLAQNLIVKTVKHSIDKEKGVADEATIRRAFNQLVKSRKSTDNNNNGRPLIVQPKESYNKEPVQEIKYTTEDTGYKFVPVVPVKERRLQGGVWIEAPKNLIGNKGQAKFLEEKRRQELIKQLESLQKYNKPNSTNNYADDEKTGSPYYVTTSQNVERKSDVSTREALSKYYDMMDATVNPKITPLHPSGNGYNVYQTNPTVTTLNYQNYRDPNYSTQQSTSNRINLLITPTTPKPYNNQLNLLVDSTPTDKDVVEVTNEPSYMGKLVPVTSIAGSSDDSNLVWVGDGLKLPLTMRKMSDGSYALTLADEVCQIFAHKKCPCCLPAGGQGVIARERRNDEQDYTDDAEKLLNKKMSGNYRVRRESSEVTTSTSNAKSLKTLSNSVGKHDEFDDVDYEDSEEYNSVGNRGGPYKYQRYASLDKLISGSTRALGNMIRLVKDVVTEAHQKIQRRRRHSTKPPVSLL